MNLEEQSCSKVSLGSEPPPATPVPSYPGMFQAPRTHLGIAIISAIIGLFIFPEIFDSVAILLGAYAWKRQQGNAGLYVVVMGIAFMLIGMYFTAFVIGDLFP